MSEFLLDTNVISELAKDARKRDTAVVAWLAARRDASWLSVVTVLEVVRGIRALRRRQPQKAARLDAWFSAVRHAHGDRLLAVDEGVARIAGDWMAAHGLSVEDALIGATAARRRLALVTRNTRYFARLGLDLVDPAQG